MKRLLIILTISWLPFLSHAQRIVGELEANTDMQMVPEDSARTEKKKLVPAEVYAWTIDKKYGNRYSTYVDTLQHQFQNKNLTEGMNGHFSHLGNLGSPRINKLFMEREDNEEFIFIRPFSQFYVPTEQFRFYNTKSPYLNATYTSAGDKQTGDDYVKVIYTVNAGKRINFGGLFDYMYGEGYYANQSTSFMGASAWASYIGEKYDFHFSYTHNYMKMAENGGITDENYITHPEMMKKQFESDDIPVWLQDTWSKQEHDIIHFNHRYNVGFMRETEDSTGVREEFVPVTSFFHTFDLKYMRRAYIAYNTPAHYHTHSYFERDSTNDRTKNFEMRNLVGVSLREGFNRYAAAGLNAYIGFTHRSYELLDTLASSYGQSHRYINNKVSENDVLLGGQIIRTQGTMLHYNIDGEFTIAGERIGNFNLAGRGELNFPLLGKTAQFVLNVSLRNEKTSYYQRHYHSRHAWWDADFDKEMHTKIEGQLSIPTTRTVITAGAENIKNYAYFENTGTPYTDGTTSGFSNNITPRQYSGNLQVISANLRQDFKFGPLHFDNDITYQRSSNEDILPLPTLTLYSNLYLKFAIAKVLKCELGADVKYFSEYYAPDYSPVASQFMLQNRNNRIKVGNYPLVSAYINADLKRTRFFIQYYHVNQSDGRYFWLPGYPMNPSGLHAGISWNFYD